MFDIQISKAAIKQLSKLPAQDFKKIKVAVLNLAENPCPPGYLKLKGRSAYRIRVGDYRIIYEIQDRRLLVLIIVIAHRKDVYNL